MHEGDRYFEHCYGADFDRRVTPAQNEACWQAWLAHYTRYQPAHRVDYAMRRMEALQAGEPVLKLPGLARNADAPEVDPEHQALLETAQAGAPPKLAMNSADAGAPTIPNGCLDTCSTYEARCIHECADEMACRHGCTRERAICLGACH